MSHIIQKCNIYQPVRSVEGQKKTQGHLVQMINVAAARNQAPAR